MTRASSFLLFGMVLQVAQQVHAEPRILMFSRTAGFRHDSIADGVAMMRGLAREGPLVVESTEEAAVFSDEGLESFRAVVWVNTTGDVLDEVQQAAFERFIVRGGGWVGVHSAADTAEIVLGIEIALGRSPLGECAALDVSRDGDVSVEEIVEAVAYPSP